MHHRAAIGQLRHAEVRIAVLLKREDRHIKSFARDFERLHGFVHAAHQRVGGLLKRGQHKAAQHFLLRAARLDTGRSASVGSHQFIRYGGQVGRGLVAGLAHLAGKNRRRIAAIVEIQRGAGNDVHGFLSFICE